LLVFNLNCVSLFMETIEIPNSNLVYVTEKIMKIFLQLVFYLNLECVAENTVLVNLVVDAYLINGNEVRVVVYSTIVLLVFWLYLSLL